MNQMENVSDEELKRIENTKTVQQPVSQGISDEKLIAMTQATETSNPVEAVLAARNEVNQDLPAANYWEIKDLPSKSKFYPAGTKIYARPMKVPEVKKVTSISEENGDFILNDIVRRTTKGIVADEIYVADKLFIIFWLRANTYRDSGYVVKFVCPKCERQSEYHFEIDNLEVQYVSDDFSPNVDLKLQGGDLVRYDYLKIKDELYIDRFKELNTAAVGDIDDELLGMAQMIKSINGKEMTLLHKYHWITEMDPGEYVYLRSYMEKKGMGIKPFVNVECQECGGTAPVPVSFREDFIIPQYNFE